MRRSRDPKTRILTALSEEGALDYERIRAHTDLGGLEVVRALEALERDGRIRMERGNGRLLWFESEKDLMDQFSQRTPTGPKATLYV